MSDETSPSPTQQEAEVLVALDVAALEVQNLAGSLNAAISALNATGEMAPIRKDRVRSVREAARRIDDVLSGYLRLARRRLSEPFAAPRLTWASDVQARAASAAHRAVGAPELADPEGDSD